MFGKKEPVKPQEFDVSGLLAKLHELQPDKQYVLWFKQALNPQHIRIIRDSLQGHLNLKVAVIYGTAIPEIYEFKEETNG